MLAFLMKHENSSRTLYEFVVSTDELEDLTGIDLDVVSALIKGVLGGTDFLQRLKAVADAAAALVDELRDFDLLAGLSSLAQGGDA